MSTVTIVTITDGQVTFRFEDGQLLINHPYETGEDIPYSLQYDELVLLIQLFREELWRVEAEDSHE
jgi:hypothetical protein